MNVKDLLRKHGEALSAGEQTAVQEIYKMADYGQIVGTAFGRIARDDAI